MANTNSIVNTNRTAFFLKPADTLPVPPDGFVEAAEPTIVSPEFTSIEYKRIGGNLNSKETIVDACAAKATFDLKHTMRTSNIAGDALNTPPDYGLLLQAAGFIEKVDSTVPGEEFVTYENGVDSMPNNSAVSYMDGNKFEFTDSLGCGITVELQTGAMALMTANFSGYLDSPTPVAEPNPTVTLSSEAPLIVSCADIFTFDGDCLPLEKVTITTNPEYQDIYTMGGTACGMRSNFVSDYALQIEAEFFVDSTTFGREPSNIESGAMKAIEIKLGLDGNSAPINGKSLYINADLAKTVVYSDTVDREYLKRTVTYRLMDGSTPALMFKTGFLA